MHGVEPKANRAFSEDKMGQSLITRARDDYNAYHEEDDYQKLLLPIKSENDYSIMSGKSPLKKSIKRMTEVKLLDLRNEEQKDQEAVRHFVKNNIKIIRHLFNQYCFSAHTQKVTKTFEEKHG